MMRRHARRRRQLVDRWTRTVQARRGNPPRADAMVMRCRCLWANEHSIIAFAVDCPVLHLHRHAPDHTGEAPQPGDGGEGGATPAPPS